MGARFGLPTRATCCASPTHHLAGSRACQVCARCWPISPTEATRHDRFGRLEIVKRAHGVGGYADWLDRAQEHSLGEGLAIVVAAPEDILRSKDAAGREKDRAAVGQMRSDFTDSGALPPEHDEERERRDSNPRPPA